MTQQSLAEAAVEVMKRVEDENRAKSSVEVVLERNRCAKLKVATPKRAVNGLQTA